MDVFGRAEPALPIITPKSTGSAVGDVPLTDLSLLSPPSTTQYVR